MFKFIKQIQNKIGEIEPIKEGVKYITMKLNIFRTNIDDLRAIQEMNQEAVAKCVNQNDIINRKVELLHERFTAYDLKIGEINDKIKDKLKKLDERFSKVDDEIANIYEAIKLSRNDINKSYEKREKELVTKYQKHEKTLTKSSNKLENEFKTKFSNLELDFQKVVSKTKSQFSDMDKVTHELTTEVKARLNHHYYDLQKAFNDFVKGKGLGATEQRVFNLEKEIKELNVKIANLFFSGDTKDEK